MAATLDRSLVDHVADRVRTAIQAGELSPGAPLVERRLAAEFGVSHIPVREALARLVEEGLVDRQPRRSARVSELTPATLAEVGTLRVLLESFVVQRVQERWSPAAEHELRAIAARMVAAARDGDVHGVYDLDERFHAALWRLADHGLLLDVTAGLRGRIRRFLVAAAAGLDHDALVRHAHTHDVLIDVIAAGDPAAAAAAMREHVEIATARIQELR